jgi:hypothetical protein
VTAIITTVVGGVLSQDRIDSLFAGDEPSESASAEVEIDYKHVTESERAIAIDVPESWGAVNAAFGGIGGVTSPGLGLRSGPDPMAVVFANGETVWVGASTQAFDDLGLGGLDDAAVTDRFEARLESSVYLPAHGCVPGARHAPHLGDDWVGAVKAWQDCSAIEGWRASTSTSRSAWRPTPPTRWPSGSSTRSRCCRRSCPWRTRRRPRAEHRLPRGSRPLPCAPHELSRREERAVRGTLR